MLKTQKAKMENRNYSKQQFKWDLLVEKFQKARNSNLVREYELTNFEPKLFYLIYLIRISTHGFLTEIN